MTVRTSLSKILAVAVAAASLLSVAVGPASAGPDVRATIFVVHGIPGQRVDVCITGLGEVASGVAYAERFKKRLDPGTYTMKVRTVSRAECRGDVITKTPLVLGDLENLTAVVRFVDGDPGITKFANDMTATPGGQIRLVAAHMMKGDAVDVWANGVVEIADLVRGTNDSVNLAADDVYSVWASKINESAPIVGPRVIDNTTQGQTFTFVMVGTKVSNNRVVVFKQDVGTV